jgi:hypothetical protein
MSVWNSVLIPRFKEAFTLSYFQAMLVQFAFFGASSIPAAQQFIIYATSRGLKTAEFHCVLPGFGRWVGARDFSLRWTHRTPRTGFFTKLGTTSLRYRSR